VMNVRRRSRQRAPHLSDERCWAHVRVPAERLTALRRGAWATVSGYRTRPSRRRSEPTCAIEATFGVIRPLRVAHSRDCKPRARNAIVWSYGSLADSCCQNVRLLVGNADGRRTYDSVPKRARVSNKRQEPKTMPTAFPCDHDVCQNSGPTHAQIAENTRRQCRPASADVRPVAVLPTESALPRDRSRKASD